MSSDELVGELMGHQFVVGTTRQTALGLTLMKPEPNHGCVVFFTCREKVKSSQNEKDVSVILYCIV